MRTDEADLDSDLAFDAVPAADLDAEVDPHWLELRGEGLLPSLYMPAPMAGQHGNVMRAVAMVLVSVFVLATSLGICMTYGPHS